MIAGIISNVLNGTDLRVSQIDSLATADSLSKEELEAVNLLRSCVRSGSAKFDTGQVQEHWKPLANLMNRLRE
jgi:hypothetical protein